MAQDKKDKGETGGAKGVLNKAADLVGGVVGKAAASTTGGHSAEAFVTNACIADSYEIAAGMVALQRAQSEPVREFGRMMVEHHTTAMHQMQAALMSSEVTRFLPDLNPPTELDERRKGMLRHLAEASAQDFDKTYLDQQKLAHEEAVTLHRTYAEHGENPQLRSVAIGGLPMIERHLKTVERVGVH